MNDILILTATAGASALVGAGLMFACSVRGINGLIDDASRDRQRLTSQRETIAEQREAIARYHTTMQGYHDELTQAQNRINRALAQVTPGANATVLRIARMLTGRQA